MNDSRAINRLAAATVIVVAVVSSVVSYTHAVAVVSENGEKGILAYCYPLTIDGLVYAASLSLLASARKKSQASTLAKHLLWLGIAVTIAVNILDGSKHGNLGAVIAAWPAIALVGTFELLMKMIRDSVDKKVANNDPLLVSALTAFPDNSVPTLASIKRTLQVGDTNARKVREFLITQKA